MGVRDEADFSGLLAKEELRKIREEKMLDQMGQVNTKLGELGGQVKSICELYPELCEEVRKGNKPQQVPAEYLAPDEHPKMWQLLKACPECMNGFVGDDGKQHKGVKRAVLGALTKEELKKFGMENPKLLEKFDIVCKDGECKPILKKQLQKKKEKKEGSFFD